MKRTTLKKWKLADLKVNRTLNFRKNYDLPSMIEQITQEGRILEPVHVEDNGDVLKGNRRISAAQLIVADPKSPQELVETLKNVDVFVYSDLTDRERTEIILDHGAQKTLGYEETVEAIWRLQHEGFSGREIMVLMYQLLAKYTGAPQKAVEAERLEPGSARDEFLSKWLNGTLNNKILNAGRMGGRVKRQFILAEIAKDRALTDVEKKEVEFEVNVKRIGKLRTAINADEEAGTWDMIEMTGPKFEEQIAEFKKEDKEPPARATSFSKEQMKEMAATMQNPGVKAVFLKCAGMLPEADKGKIAELDVRLQRQDKIDALNRANVDRIAVDEIFTGHQVKALVQGFLAGPVAKYESTLATFLSATPAVEETSVPNEKTEAAA